MDNSGSSTRVEGSVEEKYAPLLAIDRLDGGLLGGSRLVAGAVRSLVGSVA